MVKDKINIRLGNKMIIPYIFCVCISKDNKIRSGRSRPVPIDVELVGTPSSMETAFVVAKISRRLAVRKEDCRRGIGRGQ